MGTYADESPDASIGQKVANSVKKTVASVAHLAAPHSVTDIKARTDDGADNATTSSNTGPTGQSTDSYNKY